MSEKYLMQRWQTIVILLLVIGQSISANVDKVVIVMPKGPRTLQMLGSISPQLLHTISDVLKPVPSNVVQVPVPYYPDAPRYPPHKKYKQQSPKAAIYNAYFRNPFQPSTPFNLDLKNTQPGPYDTPFIPVLKPSPVNPIHIESPPEINFTPINLLPLEPPNFKTIRNYVQKLKNKQKLFFEQYGEFGLSTKPVSKYPSYLKHHEPKKQHKPKYSQSGYDYIFSSHPNELSYIGHADLNPQEENVYYTEPDAGQNYYYANADGHEFVIPPENGFQPQVELHGFVNPEDAHFVQKGGELVLKTKLPGATAVTPQELEFFLQDNYDQRIPKQEPHRGSPHREQDHGIQKQEQDRGSSPRAQEHVFSVNQVNDKKTGGIQNKVHHRDKRFQKKIDRYGRPNGNQDVEEDFYDSDEGKKKFGEEDFDDVEEEVRAHENFEPKKTYTQVRHQEKSVKKKQSPAESGPKIKEKVTISKTNIVYSEKGKEDEQFDHGKEESFGEIHSKTKKPKNNRNKRGVSSKYLDYLKGYAYKQKNVESDYGYGSAVHPNELSFSVASKLEPEEKNVYFSDPQASQGYVFTTDDWEESEHFLNLETIIDPQDAHFVELDGELVLKTKHPGSTVVSLDELSNFILNEKQKSDKWVGKPLKRRKNRRFPGAYFTSKLISFEESAKKDHLSKSHLTQDKEDFVSPQVETELYEKTNTKFKPHKKYRSKRDVSVELAPVEESNVTVSSENSEESASNDTDDSEESSREYHQEINSLENEVDYELEPELDSPSYEHDSQTILLPYAQALIFQNETDMIFLPLPEALVDPRELQGDDLLNFLDEAIYNSTQYLPVEETKKPIKISPEIQRLQGDELIQFLDDAIKTSNQYLIGRENGPEDAIELVKPPDLGKPVEEEKPRADHEIEIITEVPRPEEIHNEVLRYTKQHVLPDAPEYEVRHFVRPFSQLLRFHNEEKPNDYEIEIEAQNPRELHGVELLRYLDEAIDNTTYYIPEGYEERNFTTPYLDRANLHVDVDTAVRLADDVSDKVAAYLQARSSGQPNEAAPDSDNAFFSVSDSGFVPMRKVDTIGTNVQYVPPKQPNFVGVPKDAYKNTQQSQSNPAVVVYNDVIRHIKNHLSASKTSKTKDRNMIMIAVPRSLGRNQTRDAQRRQDSSFDSLSKATLITLPIFDINKFYPTFSFGNQDQADSKSNAALEHEAERIVEAHKKQIVHSPSDNRFITRAYVRDDIADAFRDVRYHSSKIGPTKPYAVKEKVRDYPQPTFKKPGPPYDALPTPPSSLHSKTASLNTVASNQRAITHKHPSPLSLKRKRTRKQRPKNLKRVPLVRKKVHYIRS